LVGGRLRAALFFESEGKMQAERFRGMVSAWNEGRGFGWVRRDGSDDGKDIFCHAADVIARGHVTLHAGQVVEYGVEQTPRGPRCSEVEVIEEPSEIGATAALDASAGGG
jgi:CspA family cold shock protein